MKFESAQAVEQICWQMRQADYPRGLNRARINDLFNGAPPFSPTEVQENGINVNVNFLEATGLGHEARTQFYGAFLKPGSYFRCTTDAGPRHKRSQRAQIVTKEINRIMKRSLPYYECFRSKFALDVLHGIGPSVFRDQERWCPQPLGIEDVMMASNTLLTMENVPFFALYRSYSAPELIKLTKGPNIDPAWNMPLVDAIIEWIDREAMAMMGSNFPDIWAPEKAAERIKGDGGFYVGDRLETANVWDFYFWHDDGKKAGWQRRMILDAWSTPEMMAGEVRMSRKKGDPFNKSNEFLYNPGDRLFADQMTNIVNFQFADLSAVAPFRYHSVRSLGFLMYAACHLQNRLRCKFNEAVFEALLMYFKVKSMDDAQRALKVELANKGFIDDSLMPLPASERFQVNTALVQLGINENTSLIAKHSTSYTTNPHQAPMADKLEKTRFQVLAELQQMTSLVSAALMQSYSYQGFEYREIFRRFCRPNSVDPDVREFQDRCFKQLVPPEMLSAEQWEIEPERVLGAGNATLEMTIAEQLMQIRPLYDPSAQRQILRDVTFAITSDPGRAQALVPEQPEVSDSVHDAQLRYGSLMAGAAVNIKDGTNHTEVIETLLAILMGAVQAYEQSGQLPDPKELFGFQNVAAHITQEIEVVAQDKNEKQKVAAYGQALGEITNLIKAQMQRLQEAMAEQQGQNGQGGMDPKDMAKIQAIQLQAQAKAENTRQSHAERTAQRQIKFELEQKREEQRHRLKMKEQAEQSGQQLAREQLSTRQELKREGALTVQELRHEKMRTMQEAANTPEIESE